MELLGEREKAVKEARKIATQNGAPVWIEYSLKWRKYIIHESPEYMPDRARIIEPGGIK